MNQYLFDSEANPRRRNTRYVIVWSYVILQFATQNWFPIKLFREFEWGIEFARRLEPHLTYSLRNKWRSQLWIDSLSSRLQVLKRLAASTSYTTWFTASLIFQ